MKSTALEGPVLFLLLVVAAAAYNVHQKAPAKAVKAVGGLGELFGFSVALHQFTNGSTV